MSITHDQAVVKSVPEKMSPQARKNEVSINLSIDGGINMNMKKMQVLFKKLSIGVAVSSLMNMSVLP